MLQEVNILEDNYVYYKYTWSIFEIVLIVFLGGTNMNCNLKRSKRIAIYGAGKIARYAYAQIVNAGYMPAYFIVSKKEDNPETLYGMAVREVNEVRDEIQDMQIVVGVSSKYKEEIIMCLYKYGCRDIIMPWIDSLSYLDNSWMKYPDYLELWYCERTGRRLNWNNLNSFREKMQYFKLYGITDQIRRLSDKILVRDFVKERIGDEYLTRLYGTWDHFDEIEFERLPEKYVLKCNHGCGYNYIVMNNGSLDVGKLKPIFSQWMNMDYAYETGLEMQYHGIEPKIYAEEYMENSDGDLYDYKFWCFDGKVDFIMFLSNRKKNLFMNNYDINWNILPFTYDHPNTDEEIKKPKNLEKMIHLAETLAEGFSHVRVDFYCLNDGTVKFGEMTFTSASGVMNWSDDKIDGMLGNKWNLFNRKEQFGSK